MTAARQSLKLLALAVGVVLIIGACGGEPASEEFGESRADIVASTILTEGPPGALTVVSFGTPDHAGDSPEADISLSGCRQTSIVEWELTGSVELHDGPSTGWVLFRTDAGTGDVALEVDVAHTGSWTITVVPPGLTDLARLCELWIPEAPERSTSAPATPIEGAFTWDAEPGTIDALGSGLVAGHRQDPRRAWADQYWFGRPLPFDAIATIDSTLVGVPRVLDISVSEQDGCRSVFLAVTTGVISQSQGCFGEASVVVDSAAAGSTWERYGELSGLLVEASGRTQFIAAHEQWTIAIEAGTVGDIAEIASSIVFSRNTDPSPARRAGDVVLEEDLVTAINSGVFREIGRVDADGGRYLVVEGPLNPQVATDYLGQLRVYRLDEAGIDWNPLLVGGGTWDRCLSGVPISETQSIAVVADTASSVEAVGGGPLTEDLRNGRLILLTGRHWTQDLSLLVDGDPAGCEEIITTLPTTVPTTTGTVPGTTDDTTPPGNTDTTTP